jgi:hypothetical protein
MNQRALFAVGVLSLAGCQDWEQALAECRDAGGCRKTSESGAALVIEPAQFDFGGVVPTEQASLPFVVRNVGVGPASGISLFDPTNAQFTVGGACSGASLEPNATCMAEAHFTPTQLGPASGELRVGGDGLEPVSGTLSGDGVLPLTVEPITFDFGQVPVNTLGRKSFVVTNHSTVMPTTVQISFTHGAFPGVTASDAGTCRQPLAPGSDCSFELFLSPRQFGAHDAGVVVSGRVDLAPRPREEVFVEYFGEGVAGLGIAPVAWAPTVESGQVGSQVFTVSNSLTVPVGPLTVSLSQSTGAFSFDAGCEAQILGPSDSCTVAVEFRPVTGLTHNGSLLITGGGASVRAGIAGTSPLFVDVIISPAPDGGTLEVPSMGISCPGGACSVRTPLSNMDVMAQAIPDPGMEFLSWTAPGVCSGAAGQCIFVPTTNRTFSATFRRQRVQLTLEVGDGGSVHFDSELTRQTGACPPACDAGFEPGEAVVLSAAAQPGSTLASWGGDCPDGNWTQCRVIMSSARVARASFAPANVAFVASGQWPNPGTPADADQFCQATAADAGLPGASTFVAWVNGSRLQSNGWVRSDGLPFSASQAALLSSPPLISYPLSNDERGAAVGYNVIVYTGTRPDGGSAGACTSTAITGNPYSGSETWTERPFYPSCSSGITNTKVYCFGNFTGGLYRAPAIPPWGRRVFVTSSTRNGNTPTATMDSICNAEAQDAGLPGVYLGLRAAVGVGAVGRFNFDGGGWFRTDGTVVFGKAEHANNELFVQAPINITARGAPLQPDAGSCVWLGDSDLSTTQATAASTCSNWTTASGSFDTWAGNVHAQDEAFTVSSTQGCDGQCRFYCFEQ